jgi:DNA-directed RNA polymerase specialized sigma24 family protein
VVILPPRATRLIRRTFSRIVADTARERDEGFQAFVRARSSALLRTAVLLTGDVHHGQDLLQEAL